MTGSVLNVIIKLVALLLAILLWFNVITKKQYEHDLTLEVTDIELPANLGLVTPLPDSLTVRVLAEGRKLLSGDWKKNGLRIKATRLRYGVNNLELNVETVSLVRSEDVSLLDMVNTEPIKVELDYLDSLLLPVASRLMVMPDDGYMVVAGKSELTPLKTRTVGPRKTLRGIDSIYTEQKIIDDADETVHVSLPLEKPTDMNITLAHDSARIEIVVDKIITRKFNNLPVSVSASSGKRIVVDPAQVGIEVEGPKMMIDSLQSDQIKISVTPVGDVSDTVVSPVVDLPPNFRLVAVNPGAVRLVVSE